MTRLSLAENLPLIFAVHGELDPAASPIDVVVRIKQGIELSGHCATLAALVEFIARQSNVDVVDVMTAVERQLSTISDVPEH